MLNAGSTSFSHIWFHESNTSSSTCQHYNENFLYDSSIDTSLLSRLLLLLAIPEKYLVILLVTYRRCESCITAEDFLLFSVILTVYSDILISKMHLFCTPFINHLVFNFMRQKLPSLSDSKLSTRSRIVEKLACVDEFHHCLTDYGLV